MDVSRAPESVIFEVVVLQVGCEIAPNSAPGIRMLKCLIRLLFPGFSKGTTGALWDPQPIQIFAMKSAD